VSTILSLIKEQTNYIN